LVGFSWRALRGKEGSDERIVGKVKKPRWYAVVLSQGKGFVESLWRPLFASNVMTNPVLERIPLSKPFVVSGNLKAYVVGKL
jgi:hypothetical protein